MIRRSFCELAFVLTNPCLIKRGGMRTFPARIPLNMDWLMMLFDVIGAAAATAITTTLFRVRAADAGFPTFFCPIKVEDDTANDADDKHN